MKVALITGGSRGIGLGIAHHLAAGGYHLAINGIRPAAAVQEALAELKGYDIEVIYCQADIARAEQRAALLQQVKQHFGCLHLLVNNAGIAPRERKDILEATEQSFDEVLFTNLKGPYFLTQAAANWMISQQQADKDYQACIINISSISATIASVNRGSTAWPKQV